MAPNLVRIEKSFCLFMVYGLLLSSKIVTNSAMKTVFVKMLILVGVLGLIAPISACGVKPNQVDPPEEVKDDLFPNRYPAEQIK